jgi:hypothetical protein
VRKASKTIQGFGGSVATKGRLDATVSRWPRTARQRRPQAAVAPKARLDLIEVNPAIHGGNGGTCHIYIALPAAATHPVGGMSQTCATRFGRRTASLVCVDPLTIGLIASRMAISLMSLLKPADAGPRGDTATPADTFENTFDNTLATEAGKGFAGWVMRVLTRRSKSQPNLQTSMERVASTEDPKAQDELIQEILIALREEPGLLQDARQRLASISVSASGVRSVAVGRDVRGTINTGDIGP